MNDITFNVRGKRLDYGDVLRMADLLYMSLGPDWLGRVRRGGESLPDWAHIVVRLLSVIDQLMPGIGAIACKDYKEINDAPCAARAALVSYFELKN